MDGVQSQMPSELSSVLYVLNPSHKRELLMIHNFAAK